MNISALTCGGIIRNFRFFPVSSLIIPRGMQGNKGEYFNYSPRKKASKINAPEARQSGGRNIYVVYIPSPSDRGNLEGAGR